MNHILEAKHQAKKKIIQYFVNNANADLPAVVNPFYDHLAQSLAENIVGNILDGHTDPVAQGQRIEKFIQDEHAFLLSCGLIEDDDQAAKPLYHFLISTLSNVDRAQDLDESYIINAYKRLTENFLSVLKSWILGEMFVNISDELENDQEFLKKFIEKQNQDFRFRGNVINARYLEQLTRQKEHMILDAIVGNSGGKETTRL